MNNHKQTSGFSLVAATFAIAMVSVLLIAAMSLTDGEAIMANRSVDRAQAIAYGNGVVECLFDQWRTLMTSSSLSSTSRVLGCTNSELLPAITSATTTATSGALWQLVSQQGINLVSGTITAADQYGATTNTSGPASRPAYENGTNSRLRLRFYYVASATVSYTGGHQVTVQRTFVRGGRNLFDNFLFSSQPVTEIAPGATMVIGGSIYAGGSLYIPSNNLVLEDPSTFTGSMSLTIAPLDPRGSYSPMIVGNSTNFPAGPPQIGLQQKLLDVPANLLDPNFTDGINTNDINSDGNPNNDGYYEILKAVSDSTKSDPLQIDTAGDNERFSVNADYRIYVDASNNVTIYKGSSTTALPTTDPAYTALKGAITTNGATNPAIYDQRQGGYVGVVNLNVGAVNTAMANNQIQDNAGNGDGLEIYINDTALTGTSSYSLISNTSSVNVTGYVNTSTTSSRTGTVTYSVALGTVKSTLAGIRLVNGQVLPSGGLTIATPNPVYIQGDYNTGSTTTTPASDNSGAYPSTNSQPAPEVGASVVNGLIVETTYQRAASLIAADAVTVLSNNWSDSAASLSFIAHGSAPTAGNTTINTAIISGNVPSCASSYSGGIENFTRFLENWSGVNFTIYGAFGLLFDSEQARGFWNANTLYSPPNRHWFFDSQIMQNYNPPGLPTAYVYARGPWNVINLQ